MSVNWDLLGNEWAVQLLQGQIANGRLRQAYLFTGPTGMGRRTIALRLAQALNCANPPSLGDFCGQCRNCLGFAKMQHSDFLLLEKQEGDRDIKVEAVRELTRSLSLTPLEAKFQMALIRNFEDASEQAANALLKTLEEPNRSVVLCITAPDTDSLPATIVSRCEVLRMRPVAAEHLARQLTTRIGIDPKQAQLLASLSDGRPGAALRLREQPADLEQRTEWLNDADLLLTSNRVQRFAYAERVSKDRQALNYLLLVWLSFWRDVLLAVSRSSAPLVNLDRGEKIKSVSAQLSLADAKRVLTAIDRSLEQLRTNVNARLAMEVLLLEFPNLKNN